MTPIKVLLLVLFVVNRLHNHKPNCRFKSLTLHRPTDRDQPHHRPFEVHSRARPLPFNGLDCEKLSPMARQIFATFFVAHNTEIGREIPVSGALCYINNDLLVVTVRISFREKLQRRLNVIDCGKLARTVRCEIKERDYTQCNITRAERGSKDFYPRGFSRHTRG